LSSAGANLFHAVVELQRLRASSERKFQRWFFETRTELERNQEVTAMLEAALEEERRNRADAIRQAVEQEQGSSKLHKQLAEMRKELTISKEEARRAWEELGRREEEERQRTTSLQHGQPTIVGGVQVVPMTQGVSRGNTQREPRYAQPEIPEYTQSPTPRAARPEYTQAPAVQSVPAPSAPNPAFQTPSSVHHQQSYGSEGTMSEGEYIRDAAGNFVLDARGRRIPYRIGTSDGSDV
jgi:DNA-binding phage protein